MSPILFFGLNEKLLQVTHNTYKSDVFSLGMCILYAATLSLNSLYDIREMTDMKDIRYIIEKYCKRYSFNLIEILLCMLEVNEKKRPDFIQLEKIISLFGIK
jgi:serine/threonine protein kinase